MTTTPYQISVAAHPLPYTMWTCQSDSVDQLAELPRSGLYAEVGMGKTGMATAMANYQRIVKMAQCHFVLVPPILTTAWMRWLAKIPGVTSVVYEGTPTQRKKIKLLGHDFVVMSLQIFKRDYVYLFEMFKDYDVGGIVDEATAIKNVESQNHQKVRDFFVGRTLMLLTGTPLATPADGYAYIKLIAPTIYRSKRMFEMTHVESRDFFGNVQKWMNLDVLQKNMKVNTVRLLKAEHLPDLKLPIYDPIPYHLAPEHLALYNRLVEDQLIELENGGKIDATSVSKLFACLQQIVMNWGHFSGNMENVSAGFDVMDQVIEEVGCRRSDGGKLLVFANYRMTMGTIRQRYQDCGIQIINGDTTPKDRIKFVDSFVDPSGACRTLAIQPKSGGYGLDGIQTVCNDVLFPESPTSPIEFEQCVGRVYRPGQKYTPHIRIAEAQRTIQSRLLQLLLKNDELTTFVQGGLKSLRAALYGEVCNG